MDSNHDVTSFIGLLEQLVSSNKIMIQQFEDSFAAGETLGFTKEQFEVLQKPFNDLKETTRLAENITDKFNKF